jgi:hypothetical protein
MALKLDRQGFQERIVLGWLATAVMGAAAVGMFATWGS